MTEEDKDFTIAMLRSLNRAGGQVISDQQDKIRRMRVALEEIRDYEDVQHLEPTSDGSADYVRCWVQEEIRALARRGLGE